MSEFKANVAAVELFELIFDEGGTMELRSACAELSNDSKKKVERKYGKVSTMVAEFPKYFALKREGNSRCVVEVRIPVEFCPDAGKKPGCQNRNCDKLHLCTHFLLGTCTFGEKCRKSHSIGDNNTRRVLKQAGLEFVFLEPAYLLSLLQKKVKEGEIQTTATSRTTPDACKHYNHQSGCSKGVNCPFLHVCSHYIEGDCKFKDGCKREHGFKDPHNIKVLKAYGLNDLNECHVLTILQGRPDRKRSVSANSSDSIQSDTIPHRPAVPAISRSNMSSTGSLPSKEDNKDICGFHLRGKCNYGDGCVNCHTELPYLWQYEAGAAWQSISDDLNMMIEEAFCDVTNDSFRTPLGKWQYVIHFDDMIAKPREATNIHSLKLRRLSTVSSAKAPPGHIYSTKWRWYWKDENNKWQSYDTPDDDHAASTASSDVFEKNFQSDKNGTHPFSAARHKYTMYFGLWIQENDKYGTQRAVRRRPTFVSKEGMAEIAKRKRTLGTQGTAVADSEHALPTHWDMDTSGQDFKLVLLQTVSAEYKKAAKMFEQTLPGHNIHLIERVQNADLWMEYIQKKQRMAKKAGGDILEKRLFHGTSSDIVDAICQQGFDWRMCGKHGTTYGKGSYFASTAAYSHKYARASGSPLKQMFLAKVVVGAYAAGSSSFVRPPPKDASKPHGELFDSCVDNTVNPGLFVVFDNGQSYPEYLITYT